MTSGEHALFDVYMVTGPARAQAAAMAALSRLINESFVPLMADVGRAAQRLSAALAPLREQLERES